MNSDKLWTEDLNQLFSSYDIIPTNDMSVEVKMNSLTRLVIIVSAVLALFEPIMAVIMFFICIIVIIAIYSANKEGYEDFPITSKRFCNDATPITPNDPTFISLNQQLVGHANPKTTIPPFIAAPSHDLSSWRENDLVNHSSINIQSNFDIEKSGYTSDTYLPSKCNNCNYTPCMCYVKNLPIESYKDKLLTQNIQPGVYQKSYVGEPTNSNIGISFTQPFVPTVVDETPNTIKFTQFSPDQVNRIPEYYANDIGTPQTKDNVYDLRSSDPIMNKEIEQTKDNVYDPRFTGYGTSYRGYTDKLTGQAKFFYNDVDSVIRPNYIVRSKIDTFPWADHYGPDKENLSVTDIRTLANNTFHDSALKFRTDLQERLMRKRNAEMWQRRAFPKSIQPQL